MLKEIPILVKETTGLPRYQEPVTVGVPFAKGMVSSEQNLTLYRLDKNIPFDIKVLDHWSDGSLKWALLDFRVSCSANAVDEYRLSCDNLKTTPRPVQKTGNSFAVDTGNAKFICNPKIFQPFADVVVNKISYIEPSQTKMILTDSQGQKMTPEIENINIEHSGSLRTTIKYKGNFYYKEKKVFAEFESRLNFYTNKALVKCEFTIRNPKKTEHKGGLWDLGDKGSIYMKDLSLQLGLRSNGPSLITPQILWNTQVQNRIKVSNSNSLRIYQDSSGGKNWKSKNHINRFKEIPLRFKGYQVHNDETLVEEGERANPVIAVTNRKQVIAVSMYRFWQNFPQAMEVDRNTLILRFYPRHAQDFMELQGGEQKTYRFILGFGEDESIVEEVASLQFPLFAHILPEVYTSSSVFGYITLYGKEKYSLYREFVDAGLKGPRNFFWKREAIDEYGWRHFGCVWGDHESVKEMKANQEPLISHYNNQYDLINGFLLQFARSGDARWYQLAEDHVFHTIDIDIYHTKKDKPAYNGGLFWHTEHYLPAGRGTHRTYSKDALNGRDPKHCGGGPANEHNYTTGLMNFYFLNGSEQAKEAVIGLADWVLGMDDWRQNLIRGLKGCSTSLATKTASENYQGPGRGAGNSINALLDAYILTKNNKYLKKVERFIRRCIHPSEDILKNKLDEPEYRWSYLVFLQVLGKYLDLKSEYNQKDENFDYAKQSLEHYAKWMLKNEKPYTQQKEKVLIWTETWPATDMRKSYIFDCAALYSSSCLRSAFIERGDFFYKETLETLKDFDTYDSTRSLAILISFGLTHDSFIEKMECLRERKTNE